jgi:hypothetical protein
MAQVIDLEGLPDKVAEAIAETIRNLKNGYSKGETVAEPSRKLTPAEADQALEDLLDTLPPMPSLPDKALSRESIYAAEDDIR